MVIIVSVLKFNEFLGLNGFKLMNFLSDPQILRGLVRSGHHLLFETVAVRALILYNWNHYGQIDLQVIGS